MRVEIDGEALRLARQLNRRTTTSLALAVGLTPPAICHLERGRRASVTEAVFAALVRELGIQSRPGWISPTAAHADRDTPEESSPSGLRSGITSGSISSAGDSQFPAAA